jgi:hypothetical protein
MHMCVVEHQCFQLVEGQLFFELCRSEVLH